MPTILDLVEGRELSFAGLPPVTPAAKAPGKLALPAKGKANGKSNGKNGKGSPLAQHIATHMQDPLGATKEQFGKLQEAKLNYDLAREETQRNIAPVQSTITHLSQMHGLQPMMPTPGMDQPGQGMDPNDPNQEVDENGNPLPPQNMNQQPGQINQNRPSLVGHQPGVAPMNEKQVVPPKLGMASPGSPQARNAPVTQQNKSAAPPKGNRSLPGAKGPGDAKVANRTKKALNSSPGRQQQKDSEHRPIKVTVHASACMPRVTTIEASRSLAELKFRGSMPLGPGGALGPSSVMPHNNPASGASLKAKKMNALEELSDKEPGNTQHQVAYNPVIRSTGRGTSQGAKKGWSTRGHGHLSKSEKESHYTTLDLCAKCGKIHAEGKCSMKASNPFPGVKKVKATTPFPGAQKVKAGGPGSGRRPSIRSVLKVFRPQKQKDVRDSAFIQRALTKMSPEMKKGGPRRTNMEGGGPGSGRRPGFGYGGQGKSAISVQREHIAQMQKQGHTLMQRSVLPNGTRIHDMKTPTGRTKSYQTMPTDTGGYSVTSMY